LARDYRYGVGKKPTFQRQSQQRAQQSEGLSSRQLLLAMVVMGLLLFAGYLIVSHFIHSGVRGEKVKSAEKGVEKHSETAVKTSTVSVPSNKPTQSAASVIQAVPVPKTEKTQKVDYTFYQGLAKTEVVVEAEPLPVKLPQPYYIQAGSFAALELAQKEQARLKRLGFETQLSSLQGKTRTYYRLRLGPFFDRLQLNKVRNQLRDVGVDTLLIRARKRLNRKLKLQRMHPIK